jgi:hypothetical protein
MDMLNICDLADGQARLTGVAEQPGLAVVNLQAANWTGPDVRAAMAALAERSIVTVGWSPEPLPAESHPLLEMLAVTLAPGGPGNTWVDATDGVAAIAATVALAPAAALTLSTLLPATAGATVYDGLQMESLAYSMLLAGPEFAAWRAHNPSGPAPMDHEPVLLERAADVLTVTLNRPERHNAFSRAVRDGLIDALEVARLDPTITTVVLAGAGRSFCSGGDLDEFGTATDPVAAHLVRLARSAGWAVNRIRDRVTVRVQGACIGAGVEVPSFASRVEATPDAWFQLPEIGMGLVPGAGGTVSITRRIGRWRTAYLALSGARLDAGTALTWGLVDAVG